MGRVDYSGTAGRFRQARTLPLEVLRRWTEAVAPFAGRSTRAVVDVGSGTGQFVGPLASWFSAPVVAVEPSAAMRAQAVDRSAGDGSMLVAGAAERLPLDGSSVDVAWLSTVVHQFDDLAAAAAECRRVLGPGGLVLVRGFFGDQTVTGALARFPGIERSARAFPSTTAVGEQFVGAGFAAAASVEVVEPWSFDLGAWVDQVRALRRTDSLLRSLAAHEIDEGIAMVRAEHDDDGPLVSPVTLRLLVFAS